MCSLFCVSAAAVWARGARAGLVYDRGVAAGLRLRGLEHSAALCLQRAPLNSASWCLHDCVMELLAKPFICQVFKHSCCTWRRLC